MFNEPDITRIMKSWTPGRRCIKSKEPASTRGYKMETKWNKTHVQDNSGVTGHLMILENRNEKNWFRIETRGKA